MRQVAPRVGGGHLRGGVIILNPNIYWEAFILSRRVDMRYRILVLAMAGVIAGCGNGQENEGKSVVGADSLPPSAPTMSYEQLITSGDAVGDLFVVQPLEAGNAVNYQSRAGVLNVLETVVEYPDATGYVSIDKAYKFGDKYLLVVSTGENGASCAATTYAFSFDMKSESVTGKTRIDGCSENVESLSEGNKLMVKKDGAPGTYYNGEVK